MNLQIKTILNPGSRRKSCNYIILNKSRDDILKLVKLYYSKTVNPEPGFKKEVM